MNVYVRELSTALARAGVTCDVYTRADSPAQAPTVAVEPGFRVHHVPAGPLGPVPKECLPELVPAFTEAVADRLVAGERIPDLVHANYWLSAVAGHDLKHRLDIPLVTTFHTLARVKALGDDPEPESRVDAEQAVIGCSVSILGSCRIEMDQVVMP
jgi:D-inositol-3-phosphate glycosyltransferase